jgi:hypothetical protein
MAPILAAAIVWRLADHVWQNSDGKLEFSLDDLRRVYITATSVLAIVVPVTGNLIVEARKSSPTLTLGLLVAAETLAVLALILGAYLVLQLSMFSEERLTIAGGHGSTTSWIAIAGSVQFFCVIMFLLTTWIGLVFLAATPTEEESATLELSDQGFEAPVAELGATMGDVLRQLGPPSDRGPGWLLYRRSHSKVLLCFTQEQLRAVIETEEVTHAIRRSCTDHEKIPRTR